MPRPLPLLLVLIHLLLFALVHASLDSAIKLSGKLYFGTALDPRHLSDTRCEPIARREFGSITTENTLKWGETQRVRGNFTLEDAETVVGWAMGAGKTVRGHALVWHGGVPDWVEQIQTAEEMRSVLQAHITTVVSRFRGRLYAWDVVNEVFNDDGSWRESVFFRLLGAEYVRLAFRAANAADPEVKLYLNDYHIHHQGPKLDAVIRLAQDLRAEGVPIHGIGSQTHLVVADGNTPGMAQSLQHLATSTGLEIALTEVDVRIPQPANRRKLREQHGDYEYTVAACLAVPQCVGVTVWGISDRYSWVDDSEETRGYDAPLMWDVRYVKKLAYEGAMKGIEGRGRAPRRRRG